MARRRTDDDFRVACGFFGHPKTKKLARRLGDAGVIHLLKLWAWATANRADGNLSGLTDEDIEDAVDWPGEPGAFVPTLEALRWVDGPAGSRVLHEWYEHNPYAATKPNRVERAKTAARARWEGQAKLPLDDPDDEDPAAPPPPADATSINSDAPSIPPDAPSNARFNGEQCPPLHTTPHHTPESVALARAHEASPQSQSEAEAVARALQRAGCPDANERHPVLVQAVALGVGADLTALAREKPGKGLAYLVATLRGRLADAAGVAGFPSHSVHVVSGGSASPARESEDQATARHKAEALWRELGYVNDQATELATTSGAVPQGATP